MNTSMKSRYLWSGHPGKALIIVIPLLLVSVSCSPASTQPPEQPAPSATVPQAALTTPSSTPTSEAMLPAGWGTYTSQQCEYAISYPAEMQVTNNGTYSRLLGFELANPGQGVPNFIYASVFDQDVQDLSQGEVYNYNPEEVEILLNMQVGESKSPQPAEDLAEWFTYQRMPDTSISGYPAQTYENVQPWEFPGGTKEIRYYLSLDGCTYLIGGYMDTTGSVQPGIITEELFNQIVGTIRLDP
jgi:hypothetical protein